LLDFGDQEAGAECVDSACFDEDAITHAWLELVGQPRSCRAQQLTLERLPIDAGFQASVNLAPLDRRLGRPRIRFFLDRAD